MNKIISLEYALISPSVRQDPAKLDQLLSDCFVEFPSFGVPYYKQDAFTRLACEPETRFTQQDFRVEVLSKCCVLLTYKSTVKRAGDNQTNYSMRSSIWRLEENQWRMVFHQGTRCPPFEVK